MAEAKKIKTCFVIAPIGGEKSDDRKRSDQVLQHIIVPATKQCGYEAIRADAIGEPGIITSQVIQHLIEDDLVVADLTGRNPNVFYELAIRHAIKKPVVQIIQVGELPPFDVAPTRIISVDHHDLDSVANCQKELIKQIQAVEKDPSKVDSPISVALNIISLRGSENPLEKSTSEIISMLQELKSAVGELRSQYVARFPLLTPVATDLREYDEILDEFLKGNMTTAKVEYPGKTANELGVLLLSRIIERNLDVNIVTRGGKIYLTREKP